MRKEVQVRKLMGPVVRRGTAPTHWLRLTLREIGSRGWSQGIVLRIRSEDARGGKGTTPVQPALSRWPALLMFTPPEGGGHMSFWNIQLFKSVELFVKYNNWLLKLYVFFSFIVPYFISQMHVDCKIFSQWDRQIGRCHPVQTDALTFLDITSSHAAFWWFHLLRHNFHSWWMKHCLKFGRKQDLTLVK